MLSACLVVYNEENHIRACLNSICNVVDEIIVVHDGECKDKTLEIAKEFGAKIFIESWVGIAEIHRVLSFQKATHDWILMLDADERLSSELQAKIRSLTEEPEADGYEFCWNLWDGQKELTSGWPYKAFLFRKEKMKFLAFPQMSVDVEGSMKKVPLNIEHRPNYNNYTWSRFCTKWLNWAKIQAKYSIMPYSSIGKYHEKYFSQQDFSKKSLFKRKYPILFPVYGLYAFATFLRSWGLKGGRYGLYLAFYNGLYNAAIYYYILQIQIKNRFFNSK